jgi:DNA uptake protein ComE-like DNA-binding protein
MSYTKRGTKWNILNSWWVLTTLGLGLTSWAGFVYAGAAARKRSWTIWGIIYTLPLLIVAVGTVLEHTKYKDSWINGLLGGMIIIIWVFSIIHALVIRRDFLVRREAVLIAEQQEIVQMRRNALEQLRAQGLISDTVARQATLSIDGSPPVSDHAQAQTTVNPSSKPSPLDVNNCSEGELATLPGVGVLLAKKAISERQQLGGFQSMEQFCSRLALEPHLAKELDQLVTFGPYQATEPPTPPGRLVDV